MGTSSAVTKNAVFWHYWLLSVPYHALLEIIAIDSLQPSGLVCWPPPTWWFIFYIILCDFFPSNAYVILLLLRKFCCCCYSVAELCLTLCDSTDCSRPGSSAHGISQARVLKWLPFPCPRDLPHPGVEPGSPAMAGGFFTTEPPGKPPESSYS